MRVAAEAAGKALVELLSPLAVKVVLPTLLDNTETKKHWQARLPFACLYACHDSKRYDLGTSLLHSFLDRTASPRLRSNRSARGASCLRGGSLFRMGFALICLLSISSALPAHTVHSRNRSRRAR